MEALITLVVFGVVSISALVSIRIYEQRKR